MQISRHLRRQLPGKGGSLLRGYLGSGSGLLFNRGRNLLVRGRFHLLAGRRCLAGPLGAALTHSRDCSGVADVRCLCRTCEGYRAKLAREAQEAARAEARGNDVFDTAPLGNE